MAALARPNDERDVTWSEFRAALIHVFKVRPTCIFAAGRRAFEVHVNGGQCDAETVCDLLFEVLPLAENGWHPRLTYVSHVEGTLWRVWRK